ncbi:MAG TPA: FAD:protein FMN transferase [Magnetospirillum sp.]|jgi:thiamine biosynthesis lipoprotein|nr:FAD:protein FMN transferase [Magnetospirillum sp.]
MTVQITRRRLITVAAAAAGLPLLLKATGAQARMVTWEGTTLGAPSSIKLFATDEAKARTAIQAALAELERLEGIFSVYRADTAISRLNREGKLDDAPADFVALLEKSLDLARISGGRYDPTIQPVWQTYFRHFTAANPDPNGPAQRDLDAALALVGWQNVEISGKRVAFTKPDMGLTLNSGAQGFITDKVTEVLRSHGFDRMLVDMGEPRALSTRPDGTAWRIGIANPADPSQAVTEIDVVDKAISTSGGYGTLFDAEGRFTHLIDTKTGTTAPALLGVSVVADTATIADGLSTALLMTPAERQHDVLTQAGGLMALTVTPQGVVGKVEA